MDNCIYKVCSFIWRNTFLKWYRDSLERKDERYWAEKKISRGNEYADKTFYIIRRRDVYCGICSIMLTTLANIDKAINNNYIPIVDMQNSFNIYLTSEDVGRVNSWEYFFKQPYGFGLDDITKSRNVIIGSGAVPEMFPYLNIDFLMGRTPDFSYWSDLAKKSFVLSSEAKEIVEAEYARLFGEKTRVLGAKFRGTDYISGKPKNHPIQPSPVQALDKCIEVFREQGCDKIFLSTEDLDIYNVFREYFGNDLVTLKQEYQEYCGGSIGREQYENNTDVKSQGMEYLVTTMLLAQCDCLCAGCVSGTVIALLMSQGYDYKYLFDLGVYE